MTDEAIEVVRGSGNVYRDFGYADAEVRQAKVVMAVEIMKILEREGLPTRAAEARTGVSHSEFSRIGRANLARFTIDRLIAILARLGQEVEVSVNVCPRSKAQAAAIVLHP
jgi:predicted XRE-type DNA-binding protein